MIGPNGAGKTTLIAQLVGRASPDAGAIRLRRRRRHRLPAPPRGRSAASRDRSRSRASSGTSPRSTTSRWPCRRTPATASGSGGRPGASPRCASPPARRSRSVGLGERADVPAATPGPRRAAPARDRHGAGHAAAAAPPRRAGGGHGRSTSRSAWSHLLRGLKGAATMLLVEHDMDAVFALADRITVHGLRAGDRHRPPGGDPRQPRGPPGLPRRGRACLMLALERWRRRTARARCSSGSAWTWRSGRGGHAARAQRHGQDDDGAGHHGHRARHGPARSGFDGPPIHGLPSYRVAQAGLGLVPEGRQIFPNLTVRENLVATAANRRRRAGAVDARAGVRAVPAARRARSASLGAGSPAASSRCWPSAAR